MNNRRRLSVVLLLLLFSLPAAAQMSETSSAVPDFDTTALDARIEEAVNKARSSGATPADRKAAAAAYLARANKYRDAGHPQLYKFALGDYRRVLRYDASNAEAREKMDEIVSIYQSLGRPVPSNGLDETSDAAAARAPEAGVTTSVSASQTARRIRFRRGSSSTVLKGAIVLGSTEEYLIGARAGQRITLKISSLERNAVFDLYKVRTEEPGEIALEKKSWSGVLPEDGDYLIRVGSERGNAPYTLRVTIR